MILRIIFYCLVYISTATAGSGQDRNDWKENPKKARCLTGYMTDIQTWVDEYGDLANTSYMRSSSIIISTRHNAVRRLQQEVSKFKCTKASRIQYLSMAKCKLTRVPSVFKMEDNYGRSLADTIEYVTFYGNDFGTIDSDAEMYDVTLNASETTEVDADITSLRRQLTMWSVGFHGFTFSSLRELDLRSCSIQALGNHTFQRMPKLNSLYLGENNIHYIETNAFSSLTGLKHVDLSRNYAYDETGQPIDMIFETLDIFNNIELESLDLSYTNFGQRNIGLLKSVEQSIKRLSICYAGLGRIRDDNFNFVSLKYLDVSGNTEILCSPNLFIGLNNSLQVLYAESVAIKEMDNFGNFSKLEILKLTNNEIASIPSYMTSSLRNLQILDLDNNRITSWFNEIFSRMRRLKLLSLRNNNINVITKEMYFDIQNISYLGLSGNFLVCNCYARDIHEVGLKSEFMRKAGSIIEINNASENDFITFHTGFQDFNDIISRRKNITSFCEQKKECDIEFNPEVVGNYLLLDYDDYDNMYQCLLVAEGKTTAVFKLASCFQSKRDFDIPGDYIYEWNKFLLFIIPGILLPMICFVYVFRKNLRYFVITMRNSAMLSLINKNDVSDDGTIFNYDVFVSYCNEDRGWVLDQLLPHVERDCNISVCLHERDFQVGLSILENIVSCMDRSRSIMLIISKRFLLSQWCQFEMHLAQHRLLETRREDLILILLEEIPRRLRPNTLHYLMLTKTYIVWPKEESEQNLFWRRMKKSLVTHKLKQQENVSLA